MIKMFTYGIFTNPSTCLEVFQRVKDYIEEDDYVDGYSIKYLSYTHGIKMAYPEMDASINGKVFELSEEELKVVDNIEGPSYKRINTITRGGHNVIMYIENS